MIFQLGKGKAVAEWEQAGNTVKTPANRVHQTTIERWKEIARKATEEDENIGEIRAVDLDSRDFAAPPAQAAVVSEPEKPQSRFAQMVTQAQARPDHLQIVPDPVEQKQPTISAQPLVSKQPELEKPQAILPSDPSLSVEEDLKRRFGSNIRSALGSGTMIEGRFSFDSPVRVDGSLTGEIDSSSVLIVGPEAIINARIKVGSIIILGEVAGVVEAEELVEIKSCGKFEGEVHSKRLVLDDGAYLQARCNL